jgi:hypothetical protein
MKIEKIYTSTLTLLIAHQIDAAYWKEWEMFLLPGGIQFFDLFNLGIVPALIWGLRSVILLEKKRIHLFPIYIFTWGFNFLNSLRIFYFWI